MPDGECSKKKKKKIERKRAERVIHSGSNITLCIGQMGQISEIDGAKASFGKTNH